MRGEDLDGGIVDDIIRGLQRGGGLQRAGVDGPELGGCEDVGGVDLRGGVCLGDVSGVAAGVNAVSEPGGAVAGGGEGCEARASGQGRDGCGQRL